MKLRICRICYSSITIFTIYLLSFAKAEEPRSQNDVKNALQDLGPSEKCPNVMCTKPPSDVACNKTEVTNPSILNKLGTLKSCCSAFRCSEKDGSISTYFGITGEEIPNDIVGNNSSTPQDRCSRINCPVPVEKDANCVVSNATDADDYKPQGELRKCCPLYNCTETISGLSATKGSTASKGMDVTPYHTRYVLSAGKIPKDADMITKEKGPPGKDKNCPLIKCSPKPTVSGCEAIFQNFSSSLQTLGSFQECCPLWKCRFDDGTYFTHFEITSVSFWMAETSYFSGFTKPPTLVTTTEVPKENKDQRGRGFGIPPAPGLNKSSEAASTTTEATTTTIKKMSQQQEQSINLFEPPKPKQSKSKKKDDADDEVEGDYGEEEGEDFTHLKPRTIMQQQQQNGNGQQQQQQMMVVQQPVIVHKVKRPRRHLTHHTHHTTEKNLLKLSVNEVKAGKK